MQHRENVTAMPDHRALARETTQELRVECLAQETQRRRLMVACFTALAALVEYDRRHSREAVALTLEIERRLALGR